MYIHPLRIHTNTFLATSQNPSPSQRFQGAFSVNRSFARPILPPFQGREKGGGHLDFQGFDIFDNLFNIPIKIFISWDESRVTT